MDDLPARKWVLPRTGLVLAAGAIVSITVSISGCSGSSATHAGASAATPTAAASATGSALAQGATPGPMPGAPTVTAMATTSGRTSSQTGPKALVPTHGAQVKAWNKGPGGMALKAVTTDSGNVLMSHANQQYPQMLQYCNALSADVRHAVNATPIPDGAMQAKYLKALGGFKSGISDCLAGVTQHEEGVEDTVTNVNKPVLTRAMTQFTHALSDLYVATFAIGHK